MRKVVEAEDSVCQCHKEQCVVEGTKGIGEEVKVGGMKLQSQVVF